jgi:hypothetical protein
MSRTVFATAVAGMLALVFTAVGSGGPPTGGVTASCAGGGQSVVTGFKGNPSRVDFFWTSRADSFVNDVGVSQVGGKFGAVATQATPTVGFLPGSATLHAPWSPDTLTYSVLYKEAVAVTGTVACT